MTHYNGRRYLSIVDCGPSRFAIWRELRDESAESIVSQILQIFRERGPPEALLMDNGQAFRSDAMRNLLRTWGVEAIYRCAYRPSGNAIVERNHRTIKRMAARACGDPLDMVFFYNATPREGIGEDTIPSERIFRYSWRVPGCAPSAEDRQERGGSWNPGEKVFVKPPRARCTTPWPVGTVTGVQSQQRLEVDGIPRHVSDLRRVPNKHTSDQVVEDSEGQVDRESEGQVAAESECLVGRPQRVCRRPSFYGNNIYDT